MLGTRGGYFAAQGGMSQNIAHLGAIKPVSNYMYEAGIQEESKNAKRNRRIIIAVLALFGIAVFAVPMIIHVVL